MSAAAPKELNTYRKYWASRFGTAPFLPMSRAEMHELGWDSCDVIIVTGDAYVDHPSFGMAIMGRLLEAQGFRVGIIAQPDWQSAEPFRQLGKPNLFFGITAGNMDSMVNRYTSDKRIRSDDAYTPGGMGGKRPDRSVVVYAQRAREAFKDVPIVIGGIEASLRRIAHFDYWSEKVRRSVLLDAKADLLVFGNAERQICEIAHRLATGEDITEINDLRGTAFVRKSHDFIEIDSTHIDTPGRLNPPIDPYAMEPEIRKANEEAAAVEAGEAPPKQEVVVKFARRVKSEDRERSVIRMPSFETVSADPVLYAHASRILHLEANPGNARAKRSRMCPSSSVASKRRYVASRTSTTGARRFAAACCWTPKPTCSCSATPSARSARSRTGSPAGKPSPRSTICAAPRSCASRMTSSRSTPLK
jgi:uncharacterized radical SAM protein YgiQ